MNAHANIGGRVAQRCSLAVLQAGCGVRGSGSCAILFYNVLELEEGVVQRGKVNM